MAGSIDGFTDYFASASTPMPESGPNFQAWVIRLNGARLAGDVNGLWMLDLLPVTITQLDSVAVTSAPMLVDGRPTFGGVIDLYARRPAKSLATTLDYQHGDESGDPGPYRYTARATPNVEKLGPFTSGVLSAAFGSVGVDAGARYAALNTTDTHIQSDLGSAAPTVQSDVNASGGSGIVTTSAFSGQQSFFGGRGRVTGLLRLPGEAFATGRVIGNYGGTAGSLRSHAWSARYGAAISDLDVRPLASALTTDITGDRSLADAYVEVARDSSPVLVGAGITRRAFPESSTAGPTTTGRIWSQYQTYVATAMLSGSFGAGDFQLSGVLGSHFRIGNAATIAVRITSLRADWAAEGEQAVTPIATSVLSLDEARAELPFTILQTISATAFTRVWRSNLAGVAWRTGGGLRVEGTIDNRLHLTAQAEGATRPAGTYETTPAFTARADGSWLVTGGFLLGVGGAMSSSTKWTLASGIQELDGFRRIDFSANKRLWSDRVRAQLVIRNLLNATEQYHPLGAQWNFRTHLAITIDLPDGRRVGE